MLNDDQKWRKPDRLLANFQTVGKSQSRVFLLLTLSCLGLAPNLPRIHAQDDITSIVEVPLSVTRMQVQSQKILPHPIAHIIITREFALFLSNRVAWIKLPGRNLVPLSEVAPLPKGFDWYETGCAAGDVVVVGVGSYSEEQRNQDLSVPRGGFVAGPDPAGALVVKLNPPGVELVPRFRVAGHRRVPEGIEIPAFVTPLFESCSWADGALYVGAHGYLLRLDLNTRTAEVLEADGKLEINRPGIWKEGKTIWYAADEGGMDGTWVTKLQGQSETQYQVLNYYLTAPDSILKYKNHLLTSSLAGVVEIDEEAQTYRHYTLTEDRARMRVYGLSVLIGELWGLREDGWVKFDLDKRAATLFQLEGKDASNNILSIGFVDASWYVGTDRELVKLK